MAGTAAVSTLPLPPALDGKRCGGGNVGRTLQKKAEDEAKVCYGKGDWAEYLLQNQHAFATLDSLHSVLAKELVARLETVQASDFGVTRANVRRLSSRCGVGYQEVYSSPDMTICIFLMRAGARIPLHDHPGMHVFCRLLFGRLRVLSMDLDICDHDAYNNNENTWPEEVYLSDAKSAYVKKTQPWHLWASMRSPEVWGPRPSTHALGPYERNLHEFEALEDCAFFDIVLPPYNPETGRDCTYYTRVCDDVSQRFGSCAGAGCMLVPGAPHYFFTETQAYAGPAYFPRQVLPEQQ